jgi:hypothetical protein
MALPITHPDVQKFMDVFHIRLTDEECKDLGQPAVPVPLIYRVFRELNRRIEVLEAQVQLLARTDTQQREIEYAAATKRAHYR